MALDPAIPSNLDDLKPLPELKNDDSDHDEQTDSDPRHLKRVQIMQALFAEGFSPDQIPEELPGFETAQQILAEIAEIDPLLQEAAPERPIKDINKVDLAILRLIVFESRHKKTPKKVLLNEAIELAKAYGTESSPAFVNAVLGHILLPDTEQKESDAKSD